MKKIKIYTIGKAKESWLASALTEYEKRLSPHLSIEWILAKDEKQLAALSPPSFIALDPLGKAHTSESFAKLINQSARHSFLIGGAEGISPELKSRATKLISLSPLTFTHQLTRLILFEQIYRACQIHLGTPYHK